MTKPYFPNRETFEKAFTDPAYQERPKKSLERITDQALLFSREVLTETAGECAG